MDVDPKGAVKVRNGAVKVRPTCIPLLDIESVGIPLTTVAVNRDPRHCICLIIGALGVARPLL